MVSERYFTSARMRLPSGCSGVSAGAAFVVAGAAVAAGTPAPAEAVATAALFAGAVCLGLPSPPPQAVSTSAAQRDAASQRLRRPVSLLRLREGWGLRRVACP